MVEQNAPSNTPCHYMLTAYPTLDDDEFLCADHRHEGRVYALAKAMAARFQQPNPTDEQIAWFLDDADAVVDDFDPTPEVWTVSKVKAAKEAGLDWKLKINDRPYVIQKADWEPAHPISRARWESWIGEDDA